jgi:hypothetical protein
MSAWRSNLPNTVWDVPRATQEPPQEDGGPCMYAGCPRSGTAVTDDLVACAFHRGAEAVRAGTRTIGHRAGDSQ